MLFHLLIFLRFLVLLYGQAQSNTVQVSIPFETTAIPICGAEPVFLSGVTKLVFHETILPDGETTYLFSHVTSPKITAMSES